MPILQSQWDSLLTGIQHQFDLGQNRVPTMKEQLFNVLGSMRAEEIGTGIGGIGIEPWDSYKKDGQIGELKYDELYSQSYVHVEYPANLRIEKKLLINDQHGQIAQSARRAGISAGQKMETDAASLLNLAFSGKLWSDGVVLCSASHPKSPKNKKAADVLSNTGVLALSKDNLAATRVLHMELTDDKGNLIGLMPNELWVPPSLWETAREIVGSTQDPDSANNAINPQAGQWAIKPWLRLTDANAWFIADSVWRQEVVKWYNRETSAPMLVHEDQVSLTWQFKLHYSFGVDDWRPFYGQNPN